MDNYSFNPQMQSFMYGQQQMRAMQQMFANPSQAMRDIMARNMNEMITQQLSDWRTQNPEQFAQMAQQFNGKSRPQMVSMLRKMAKEHGVDLDSLAMQYGIAL